MPAKAILRQPMVNRAIRIDRALWERALAKAHSLGQSMAEAIRVLLQGYVAGSEVARRTPRRTLNSTQSFMVPEALWDAASARAQSENRYLSEVLRNLIDGWAPPLPG